MPITWRNVGATIGAGDAARLFRGATDSIGGGLDKLTGALRQVETNREDKHEFEVERDTDAFQDALRTQFKTPEELQAAQESGAIDKLRSQFSLADADVARDEPGRLLTQIRNDTLAEQEYGLAQNVQAAQPIVEQYRGTEDVAERQRILDDPENAEILAKARLTGALQSEQYNAEAAAIARNEAEKARVERTQQEQAATAMRDFAQGKGDYYANKAAFKKAMEDKKIPSRIYGPYLDQFNTTYSESRDLSEDDSIAIASEAEIQDAMLDDVTRQQDILLKSAEERYEVDPTAPWEAGGKAGMGDVNTVLAQKEITENGTTQNIEGGWLDAMSMYSKDMGILDKPKAGDQLKGIPDFIKNNKYEILQHAAASLEPQFFDLGEPGIKGGRESVAAAVRNSVAVLMEARENKRKLEEARLAHQSAISTAREVARNRVTNFENKLRISRGLRPTPSVDQANQNVGAQIEAAAGEPERQPYEVFPKAAPTRGETRSRDAQSYDVFPSDSRTDAERILRPLR